eukprot:1527761-Alexandrium_andersonii.AAC.1
MSTAKRRRGGDANALRSSGCLPPCGNPLCRHAPQRCALPCKVARGLRRQSKLVAPESSGPRADAGPSTLE